MRISSYEPFPPHTRAFFIGAIIVLVLAFFAISLMPGRTKTYTLSPRQNAWNACTKFVEKERGISASDAQEYTPAKVLLINQTTYQVDVQYAKKNNTYRCTVENTPEGNWQVTNLQLK